MIPQYLITSQKVVTPAPHIVRDKLQPGSRLVVSFLKTLDSGLAVIPDSDPGRNDKK